MKRIISYSLFEHPACVYAGQVFYERILPATLRAAMVQFPDWIIRIHHDDSIYRNWYGDVLHALEQSNSIELVHCGHADNMAKASLWRLKPIWDASVEYVICRDADSIETPRGKKCVDEFIASGLIVHAINDHPQHDCPMMCGMIGFNAPQFRNLLGMGAESWDVLIRMDKQGVQWEKKNADQQLLMYNVWPKCKHVAFQHRFAGIRPDPAVRKSSTDDFIREPADEINRFIGDVADETAVLAFYESPTTPEPHRSVFSVREAERHCNVEPDDARAYRFGSQRYAVMGCDRHPDYMFYLPIVSQLWRLVGYTPLIFLIGIAQEWLNDKRAAGVLKLTRKAGAIINFIPALAGYRTSTLAKCVRLYASYLPYLHENDYLLTTDVDLLPLSKEFFWQGDTDKLAFWFSNAYDQTAQPDMYPMCHVGGRAGVWRDLTNVKLTPGAPPQYAVYGAMLNDLNSLLGPNRDVGDDYKYRNGAGLFDDEMYLAEFLRRWAGYKKLCQFIPREKRPSGSPFGRLDKVDWDLAHWEYDPFDAHAFRPTGWLGENLTRLEAILGNMGSYPKQYGEL